MMAVRSELQQFIMAMEKKLRKHDADKGESWKDKNWSMKEIRMRIHDEFIEYYDSRNQDELVDVANFVFFLWYHHVMLGQKELWEDEL